MSLRDHLAAVRDKISEAINSIDAAAAEPGLEPVSEAADPSGVPTAESGGDSPTPEPVAAEEPVRDGGPASV